ncbi:vitelline membrane outer layer protein 1-like [Garra rufa]|uniref:vitelline membrane outer layer protein 1-like n=1 Tax=Garra rufa TaxID=137080 RepID=UPI003CCEC701
MFSLLVFTGLQVSVESTGIRFKRSIDRHYRSELMVPNGGRWGSWGQREMCPIGTYAAGFSLKVQDRLASGDDTSLNGIRLHCVDYSSSQTQSHHIYTSVQSAESSWGRWSDIQWCPSGYLIAFQLRVSKFWESSDETAANNVRFKCSGGFYLLGEGISWGDWGNWSQTCHGKGICGIKTWIQAPQGEGDDTALNDAQMYCCN